MRMAISRSAYRDWQVSEASPAPPHADAPVPSMAPKSTTPTLSSYAEVLSRPLFSPTRRPSDDAPAAAPETPMTLVAIVIPYHRGPHALVRYGTPPETDRIVEGQSIENWTVEAIRFDRVILRKNDSVLELVPVSAPQGPSATPPIPALPSRPTPPTPPNMPPRPPVPPRPAH
jgi:hypothetical protein